jgi:tetratricopeptide (TPR) repeat protein
MQIQKIFDLINKSLFAKARIECENFLHAYPNEPNIFHLLGIIYLKEKKFEKAIKLINKSIHLNHENYSAFNNLGICYANLNNNEESLINYNKAIKLKPNFAEAYQNKAIVLQKMHLFEESLKNYDEAIKLNPNYAEAYNNKGVVLKSLNRLEEAIESYNKAITLKINYAEAYNNKGITLKTLDRFEEAIQNYNKAIELNPYYIEAYNNLSFIFQFKKDFNNALLYLNKALKKNPNSEITKFAIGTLNLKFKKFSEGWKGYESRKNLKDRDIKIRQYDSFKCPSFDQIKNKKILVYAEQGLGDTILFSRYIKILFELNNKITFEIFPELSKLFKNINNYCEITTSKSDPLKFDYVCSLMSLPMIFKTEYHNIPIAINNMLTVEQEKILFWKNKIKSDNLRIGISWRGNKQNLPLFDRFFELKSFYNISKIKNIDLISLQKDFNPKLENINNTVRIKNFENLDNGNDAFLDTVAIIENLDLIITPDTSIVHLAGTLGKKTWLILKSDPDWRWFLDDNKTPWYPSVSIFRQRKINNWEDTFVEIEDKLKELVKS